MLKGTSRYENVLHPMKRIFIQTVLVLMTATVLVSVPVGAATFGDEVAFLKSHTVVIVLGDKSGKAKVAVAPAWQGRVMTSTASGDDGQSFGWVNRNFIAAGKVVPHMNPFGGEDRFWMGPEGGQFGLFFAPGTKFDFSDWFTPVVFDTLPYDILKQTSTDVTFGKEFELTNYSGTCFEVGVKREVKLLDPRTAWTDLGLKPDEQINLVGYATINKITNEGKEAWKKETGLVSVWILGMYPPSPSATIVVPIKPGPDSELGTKVTSDYFGEVPSDRLVAGDNVIYLRADGKYRSKIGVNPGRSKAVLGIYEASRQALTIVQFNQPKDVTAYVNSLWKIQDNPYAGDVENAYNDGPPAPGVKPMGPFCEIESSSPAAALAPGQSLTHIRRTFHLTGSEAALNAVAEAELGVSLDQIKAVFRE